MRKAYFVPIIIEMRGVVVMEADSYEQAVLRLEAMIENRDEGLIDSIQGTRRIFHTNIQEFAKPESASASYIIDTPQDEDVVKL